MKKKILVIGATGLIGKAVAKQLNNDGNHVIVMSRSKEKAKNLFTDDFELIEADVLKPETIKYTFNGVDGIYISLPEKDVPVAMPNILNYAKKSGVKKIVYTSGCTVRKENAWHPMIKGHFEGEKAIMESGIPYTILKLTMVMDMIPRYANNGKPFILGKQNHGWSWIHSADIALMASNTFKEEGANKQKLTVFGNEKCTIAEAVDMYNKVFNPSAKPAKPKPYWIANALALFVGEKLKYAISIFKYFENHPEEGNPTLTYQLLGKPGISINQFFEIEKNKVA
jgi:uncharacterized protein YbjT (DUF2867 family)